MKNRNIPLTMFFANIGTSITHRMTRLHRKLVYDGYTILYTIAAIMLLFKIITMILNLDISFMEPVGMLVIFILLTAPLVPSWKPFAIITIGTLLIEIIGVYTGLPFGRYAYGKEAAYLGLLNVPLFIPLAWYILIAGLSRIAGTWWGTALLIIATDIMLEEFAVIKGYWGWETHGFFLEAPLQNYISWGIISIIGFALLQKKPALNQSILSVGMILGYLSFYLFWSGSVYGGIGILLLILFTHLRTKDRSAADKQQPVSHQPGSDQ